jgi:hypothetical protein
MQQSECKYDMKQASEMPSEMRPKCSFSNCRGKRPKWRPKHPPYKGGSDVSDIPSESLSETCPNRSIERRPENPENPESLTNPTNLNNPAIAFEILEMFRPLNFCRVRRGGGLTLEAAARTSATNDT